MRNFLLLARRATQAILRSQASASHCTTSRPPSPVSCISVYHLPPRVKQQSASALRASGRAPADIPPPLLRPGPLHASGFAVDPLPPPRPPLPPPLPAVLAIRFCATTPPYAPLLPPPTRARSPVDEAHLLEPHHPAGAALGLLHLEAAVLVGEEVGRVVLDQQREQLLLEPAVPGVRRKG
jgi:hypothetical protein